MYFCIIKIIMSEWISLFCVKLTNLLLPSFHKKEAYLPTYIAYIDLFPVFQKLKDIFTSYPYRPISFFTTYFNCSPTILPQEFTLKPKC
jgi:hypothetical protein